MRLDIILMKVHINVVLLNLEKIPLLLPYHFTKIKELVIKLVITLVIKESAYLTIQEIESFLR